MINSIRDLKTEKNTGGKKRSAKVRLSNATSLETYKGDLDFLTNKGLADRLSENMNLAQSEIHKSLYKYTITCDLDQIGIDEVYDINLPKEEKARREEMTEEEIAAEEKKETTEDYRSVELAEVEPEIVQKGDAHPIVRKINAAQKEENTANSNGAVKIKGQVQKQKESKDKNEKPEQVEIVITGNPVVEIISSK